jgi:DNA-directed RNA polymerase specialized sigma24 family protein
MGTAPVQSPTVGLRRVWRNVQVLDPTTGRRTMQLKEHLVPCHISVKTQADPHREEARHAEVSYIEFTLERKTIERGRLLMHITKRIERVPEPQRKILHLRYITGLSLEEITIQLDWFYSYKQVKRNMTHAVESYAQIHGFISK